MLALAFTRSTSAGLASCTRPSDRVTRGRFVVTGAARQPVSMPNSTRSGSTRPSAALLALELPRSVSELGAASAALPALRRVPPGDGHPVLVLPGFTASDNSTRFLRRWLRGLGYHVHGWQLGMNLGPTDRILQGLARRLEALATAHPDQAMSLVGWSLGGIYAREIARLAPDAVRGVITLGSPYRLTDREESNSGPLYNLLSTFHSPSANVPRPPEGERPSLSVPATSIYTRTDGVVPWRSCVDETGAQRENIEVRGSHSGLGHNPAAMLAIADRLAQPLGQWAPFRPPRNVRLLFPPPVDAPRPSGPSVSSRR